MNKVILVGNLVRDPEYRTTGSGIPVCNFRIAVTRRFANQQGVRESDFIDCVAWRQQADFVHRFFGKGRKIGVIGSLQTRTYDAQDGSKRYVTEVVCDECEFVDSKPRRRPVLRGRLLLRRRPVLRRQRRLWRPCPKTLGSPGKRLCQPGLYTGRRRRPAPILSTRR